jgi:hypothetical protein
MIYYIFVPKNPPIWVFLEDFGMENVGSILWLFGIYNSHLVYFSQFGYIVPRKIWQPWFSSPRWRKNKTLEALPKRMIK